MLPIRGGRKRRRSLRAAQKIEIAEEAAAKAADTTTCSLVPHSKSLYLFLAHNPRLCKNSYSLCKINLNDLQYDHEPRDLSPVLELEGNGVYPRGMGCALLHSKLYILGGELLPNLKKPKHEREIFPRHVYQVDTTKSNHSIEKMEMELNTGKPGPCVFAADAKIYALGTKFCPNLPSDKRFNIRKLASRIKLFECFDPNTNRWKVLDNPPVDEFIHWKGCNVLERRRQVLVIGREGRSSMVVLLYHLDQKKWTRYHDSTHNPFTTSMIYMALSSQEADSSHHLYGISSHAPVKSDLDIHIPSCTYEDNRLVQLSSVDKSIDIFMATPYIHLTERLLRYLGDHHFCYINYGMLPDPNGPDSYGDTMFDLCSLGITITLFKEVSHDDDDNIDGNSTSKSGGEELRHSFQAKILHSQQYLMKSPLPNMATLVECFVVSPEPKAAAPVMKASATSKLVSSLNHDPSTILYQ